MDIVQEVYNTLNEIGISFTPVIKVTYTQGGVKVNINHIFSMERQKKPYPTLNLALKGALATMYSAVEKSLNDYDDYVERITTGLYGEARKDSILKQRARTQAVHVTYLPLIQKSITLIV